MKQLDGLDQITKKFLQDLEAKGSTPIYKLSPQEARQVLENVQESSHAHKMAAQIEDHKIPGSHNKDISIRIVRPQGSRGNLPVIMYFHGGGWILGSKNTHDRLVREIANRTHAAVVFLNFTLSPEAKYPVAIEQAYTATKYIAEHGNTHNLDTNRIALFGDSVGGNMAAVVALLAKERNGPKILYQVLCYPVTDANFETRSYQTFAEGPWLTKAAMEWFWNAYLPNIFERKKHTVAPLNATLEQLKGLPPALVLTNEYDVLRDEAEAYAHKLTEAGVSVSAVRLLGTIHDCLLLNSLANTSSVKNALSLVCMHLQNAFGNLQSSLKPKVTATKKMPSLKTKTKSKRKARPKKAMKLKKKTSKSKKRMSTKKVSKKATKTKRNKKMFKSKKRIKLKIHRVKSKFKTRKAA